MSIAQWILVGIVAFNIGVIAGLHRLDGDDDAEEAADRLLAELRREMEGR